MQGAPHRTLVLSRVTVPPGAELALHHHLGSQVAHVQSGVLTYTVRSGSVVVRTGEADQEPKKVRTIAAGQTAPLRAGQWIVEQPSDIHEAANRTRRAGDDLPGDPAEDRRAARDAGRIALRPKPEPPPG